MKSQKLSQKLLIVVIALYVAKIFIRWRRMFQEWQRVKKLLMNLPTCPVPEEASWSLDFFGWMKRSLSSDKQGKIFNAQTLSKYFISSIQKVHEQFAKEEGLMCLWTLNPKYSPIPMCSIVVWDMDIVRELTSSKLLPKMIKSAAYTFNADLIGMEGILRSSHDVWHPQRVIIEKGFTTAYVNKQASGIRKTAQELIQKVMLLHHQEADEHGFLKIDIGEEMLKATMDVIGRVICSYEVGCLNNPDSGLYKDFQVALDIIQQRMRNPFLYWSRKFPLEQNREFKKRIKNIDYVVKNLISQRICIPREKREANDLLDILIQAYDGDGVEDRMTGKKLKLTEDQIVKNIRTLFFGGHDTTAATLTWSFYLLAKRRDVVQKILDEFEQNERNLSPASIEKSVYLNAVVLEVLRMYPSGSFGKELTEDVVVGEGKYLIPKGVEIIFFPYFQQRDPENYEKPNEFIPKRWLQANELSKMTLKADVGKISRVKAFYPFGLGARNCAGRKLALLEVRIFLLEFLSSFEVSLPEEMPDGFQEVPYMGVTAHPRNVAIMLKPRRST